MVIDIEVVFADEQRQFILLLQVMEGCTVQVAIEQSGVLNEFPTLNLTRNKIGIFGKEVNLDTVLQAGDRVEIYRPLLIDPKQARRQRAHKQKQTYSVV